MSDCGHGALIASGEARGLCPLCQRAEIGRLLAENDRIKSVALSEGDRMITEIERLRKELSYRVHCDEDIKIQNAEIERLRAEIERLRAALHEIVQWADAYPTNIFHEPTKDEYRRAHELLRDNGMTLDAFSASMGRHCMKGAGDIARRALEEKA